LVNSNGTIAGPDGNLRLGSPYGMMSGAIRSHGASLKTNRSITPKIASQKQPCF
jgi:hypothetical protein